MSWWNFWEPEPKKVSKPVVEEVKELTIQTGEVYVDLPSNSQIAKERNEKRLARLELAIEECKGDTGSERYQSLMKEHRKRTAMQKVWEDS